MRELRILLATAVLLATACQHPQTAPASAESGVRRIALRHRIQHVQLPIAVIDARVAGRATHALLDTGAECHVLSDWLVRELKLGLSPSKQTTYEAGGRTIEAELVEHPSLAIPGIGELPDRPVMSIDFLAELTRPLDIGVVFSPQLLAGPGEVVVLDFVRGALWVGPAAAVTEALALDGIRPRRIGARPCTDPSSPAGFLQYVVPAEADGAELGMLLDSGATHSALSFAWARGKPLEGRARPGEGRTAGAGGEFESKVVDGVSLRTAAASGSLPVLLIPGPQDPRCPADGLLGMDLLRSCVLVLSAQDALAHCQ